MPKFKLTLNKYLQPAPVQLHQLLPSPQQNPGEGNNQTLPQHSEQTAALSSQEALGKDDRVRQFCHLHLSSTPELEHPTQRSHSSLPASSRSATIISVEEHCDQSFQPRDSPPLTLTESQLSIGAASENMRPLFCRGHC